MKRRQFIALLGGAAVAWPLSARAQQGSRMKRIGVLMQFAENDPVATAQLSGFMQGLTQLAGSSSGECDCLRWEHPSSDCRKGG
jgi:putative tryptophan/tyrosine transport system substrate-binding protein